MRARRPRSTLLRAAFAALVLAAPLRAQGETPRSLDGIDALAGLDELAAQALEQLETPAAAGAVVHDGELVFARGYGLLDWDEPVRVMLPCFEPQGAYATEHITAVDLLTHRSGLPRQDLVWYGADATRERPHRRARGLIG